MQNWCAYISVLNVYTSPLTTGGI